MTDATRLRPCPQWPLLLVLPLLGVGCSSDDQRLVDLSRQSLDRQAEQNRFVSTNNQQVIDATQKLVEAEAQSRQEVAQLHQAVNSERAQINEQRDALEGERREIAGQRNRDPLVAVSIQSAVGLLVAALPLVVCLFVLRGLFHRSDDEAVVDVLLEELVAHSAITEMPMLSLASVPDRIAVSSPPQSDQSLKRLELATSKPTAPCAVIVEGVNDAEFLRRISRVLHEEDPTIPDLIQLEAAGRIRFLSSNGGASISAFGLESQATRFALLDRETAPTTEDRRRLIELLDRDPDCCAALTTKRAIENYLHPDAIRDAAGIEVAFGDFDDVSDVVARAMFQPGTNRNWDDLSRRARRRLRDKAKKWLNRDAVDQMTLERLKERDPGKESIGWLQTIAELASANAEANA